MSLQAQAFLPTMTLGSYNFVYGPNGVQFDRETSVGEHPILSGAEQTEPIGFTAKKLTYNGFLYSLNNQALTDLQNWTVQDGYFNRPVAISLFTQDNSGTSASQSWFSDVGYFSSAHFEYRGGYGIYKYWYRFAWIQALPQTVIAGTTSDSQNYTFAMGSLTTPGYIAGFQVIGTGVSTVGNAAQYIAFVKNNGGTQIGLNTNYPLGLFYQNPITLANFSSNPFCFAVNDQSGYQSIQLTTTPTGNYTAKFGSVFAGSPIVNLIYIAV